MTNKIRHTIIIFCVVVAGLMALLQPGSKWGWFMIIALLVAAS